MVLQTAILCFFYFVNVFLYNDAGVSDMKKRRRNEARTRGVSLTTHRTPSNSHNLMMSEQKQQMVLEMLRRLVVLESLREIRERKQKFCSDFSVEKSMLDYLNFQDFR